MTIKRIHNENEIPQPKNPGPHSFLLQSFYSSREVLSLGSLLLLCRTIFLRSLKPYSLSLLGCSILLIFKLTQCGIHLLLV